MALKTSIEGWSPNCWKWLHSPETRLSSDLLMSVAETLPCGICRYHMTEYVKQFPPADYEHDLPRWLVTFHNDVILRTGRGTAVSYADHWETVTYTPREHFIDYLIAVAFVIETYHDEFYRFCVLGLRSVGLMPPISQELVSEHDTFYSFLLSREYISRSHQTILDQFVPLDMHPQFDPPVVVPPPQENTVTTTTTYQTRPFDFARLGVVVFVLVLAWSAMLWSISGPRKKEKDSPVHE
jgi:hypothetical protein